MNIGDVLTRHGSDKDSSHSYGEVYDRLFPPAARAAVTAVLEVGIAWGHSLRAWAEVFPNARVVGIDISSDLVTADRIESYRCDSTDADQLAAVLGARTFDLIIDDGSHWLPHQERTRELLWPRLRPGGVYVIEDVQHVEWAAELVPLGGVIEDRRGVKNRPDDVMVVFRKE